jgi:hypothetical protein
MSEPSYEYPQALIDEVARLRNALRAMLKEYAPARDNLDPTTSTHAAAIAAYEALDHA